MSQPRKQQGEGAALVTQRGWWVRSAQVVDTFEPSVDGLIYVAHPDGRLCDAVRELVDGAEELVVLGSFLLAFRDLEASIRAARSRGVRVYILTASEKQLDRDPLGELEAARILEHRSLLDDLSGIALLRSAPGFHAKLVLADPHTSPRGLLSTANLVHSDLTWNDEAAVELTPSEIQDCFDVLRYAFWELSEHELRAPGLLRAVTPAGISDHPTVRPPMMLTTSAHDGIAERLVGLIAGSSQILLSNFTFDVEYPVVEALVDAAGAGADVTVLARPSERTARSLPAHLALKRAGAAVVGTDRMHAKLASFDGKRAVLHSSNLASYPDPSALELGIELHGARAQAVDSILQGWAGHAQWTLHDEYGAEDAAARAVYVGGGRWQEERQSNGERVRRGATPLGPGGPRRR